MLPTQTEVLGVPPQTSPGHCTPGPDAAEKETAARAHSHTRACAYTHVSSDADCAKGLHPSSATECAVATLSLGADPLILLPKFRDLEGFLRQAPVSAKERMFWKSCVAILGWEFHVGWNVWF